MQCSFSPECPPHLLVAVATDCWSVLWGSKARLRKAYTMSGFIGVVLILRDYGTGFGQGLLKLIFFNFFMKIKSYMKKITGKKYKIIIL